MKTLTVLCLLLFCRLCIISAFGSCFGSCNNKGKEIQQSPAQSGELSGLENNFDQDEDEDDTEPAQSNLSNRREETDAQAREETGSRRQSTDTSAGTGQVTPSGDDTVPSQDKSSQDSTESRVESKKDVPSGPINGKDHLPSKLETEDGEKEDEKTYTKEEIAEFKKHLTNLASKVDKNIFQVDGIKEDNLFALQLTPKGDKVTHVTYDKKQIWSGKATLGKSSNLVEAIIYFYKENPALVTIQTIKGSTKSTVYKFSDANGSWHDSKEDEFNKFLENTKKLVDKFKAQEAEKAIQEGNDNEDAQQEPTSQNTSSPAAQPTSLSDLKSKVNTSLFNVEEGQENGLRTLKLTAKEGIKADKLTFGDLTLWQAQNAGDSCSMAIFYLGKEGLVGASYRFKRASDSVTVEGYRQFSGGKWLQVRGDVFRKLIGKDDTVTNQESKETTPTLKPTGPSSFDVSNPDGTHTDLTKKTYSGIEHRQYIVKEGFAISSVSEKGTELWKAKEDNEKCVSINLYYKSDESFLTLWILRGESLDIQHFERVKGKWETIGLEEYNKKLNGVPSTPPTETPTSSDSEDPKAAEQETTTVTTEVETSSTSAQRNEDNVDEPENKEDVEATTSQADTQQVPPQVPDTPESRISQKPVNFPNDKTPEQVKDKEVQELNKPARDVSGRSSVTTTGSSPEDAEKPLSSQTTTTLPRSRYTDLSSVPHTYGKTTTEGTTTITHTTVKSVLENKKEAPEEKQEAASTEARAHDFTGRVSQYRSSVGLTSSLQQEKTKLLENEKKEENTCTSHTTTLHKKAEEQTKYTVQKSTTSVQQKESRPKSTTSHIQNTRIPNRLPSYYDPSILDVAGPNEVRFNIYKSELGVMKCQEVYPKWDLSITSVMSSESSVWKKEFEDDKCRFIESYKDDVYHLLNVYIRNGIDGGFRHYQLQDGAWTEINGDTFSSIMTDMKSRSGYKPGERVVEKKLVNVKEDDVSTNEKETENEEYEDEESTEPSLGGTEENEQDEDNDSDEEVEDQEDDEDEETKTKAGTAAKEITVVTTTETVFTSTNNAGNAFRKTTVSEDIQVDDKMAETANITTRTNEFNGRLVNTTKTATGANEKETVDTVAETDVADKADVPTAKTQSVPGTYAAEERVVSTPTNTNGLNRGNVASTTPTRNHRTYRRVVDTSTTTANADYTNRTSMTTTTREDRYDETERKTTETTPRYSEGRKRLNDASEDSASGGGTSTHRSPKVQSGYPSTRLPQQRLYDQSGSTRYGTGVSTSTTRSGTNSAVRGPLYGVSEDGVPGSDTDKLLAKALERTDETKQHVYQTGDGYTVKYEYIEDSARLPEQRQKPAFTRAYRGSYSVTLQNPPPVAATYTIRNYALGRTSRNYLDRFGRFVPSYTSASANGLSSRRPSTDSNVGRRVATTDPSGNIVHRSESSVPRNYGVKPPPVEPTRPGTIPRVTIERRTISKPLSDVFNKRTVVVDKPVSQDELDTSHDAKDQRGRMIKDKESDYNTSEELEETINFTGSEQNKQTFTNTRLPQQRLYDQSGSTRYGTGVSTSTTRSGRPQAPVATTRSNDVTEDLVSTSSWLSSFDHHSAFNDTGKARLDSYNAPSQSSYKQVKTSHLRSSPPKPRGAPTWTSEEKETTVFGPTAHVEGHEALPEAPVKEESKQDAPELPTEDEEEDDEEEAEVEKVEDSPVEDVHEGDEEPKASESTPSTEEVTHDQPEPEPATEEEEDDVSTNEKETENEEYEDEDDDNEAEENEQDEYEDEDNDSDEEDEEPENTEENEVKDNEPEEPNEEAPTESPEDVQPEKGPEEESGDVGPSESEPSDPNVPETLVEELQPEVAPAESPEDSENDKPELDDKVESGDDEDDDEEDDEDNESEAGDDDSDSDEEDDDEDEYDEPENLKTHQDDSEQSGLDTLTSGGSETNSDNFSSAHNSITEMDDFLKEDTDYTLTNHGKNSLRANRL
ncbi:hypothetical protein BEWA_036530 [Theileria equi strain WA]|uniref:Uncharacterized protein n=1 Tax=Theileria equi strain WA TaxID=1537102 RepID=L1LDU8_THEEQ|nr:hypothetical protein BEWA_036530 [Theileria equi strain WA]EKX73617.1 hypothetical protein BEWA_036530 [Theileria equi strain WA]|eukprot:XP_004833069.1 hypothetical protein BEWA_036530 [Theileria equi strain WA]